MEMTVARGRGYNTADKNKNTWQCEALRRSVKIYGESKA